MFVEAFKIAREVISLLKSIDSRLVAIQKLLEDRNDGVSK